MKIEESIKRSLLPKIETEIILSHILKADKSLIFSHPEKELTKVQEKLVKSLVGRRLKNEPLAYILGKKEFFGLEFLVDKRVLVPRPETEALVEAVLKIAKPDSKVTIVDVGTGSGCVAIALAKKLPRATILATDISSGALAVAKSNAKKHNVSKQIRFFKGDLLKPILPTTKVDFILANLPYIPALNYQKLEPQIKDWEPKIALLAGKTALEKYRTLFAEAKPFLKKGAKLFYELDGKILEKKETLAAAAETSAS